MSLPIASLRYTGEAPTSFYTAGLLPAVAGNFMLLDTTQQFKMADYLPQTGTHRVRIVIAHTDGAGGSLVCQKSTDGGVTWRTTDTAAGVAGAGPTIGDFVVEGFRDCRIYWVNPAVVQAYFEPNTALVDHRPAVT